MSFLTVLDVAELRRVQQLVGDMQRQRQELSQAVRQLTENSNTLYHQMKPSDLQQLGSHINKKRQQSSCWMETDLDTLASTSHSHVEQPVFTTNSATKPLYVDTNSDTTKMVQYRNQLEQESSGIESCDDLLDPALAGLTYQEKQEIKTVRIVKRESERRQRESRERSNSASLNLDHVQEEEMFVDDFQELQKHRPYLEAYDAYNQPPKTQLKSEINSKNPFLVDLSPYQSLPNPIGGTKQELNYYPVSMTEGGGPNYRFDTYAQTTVVGPAAGLRSKTESVQSLNKSIGDLSPVFQSEAARQIIYEMGGNTSEENSDSKIPLSNKHRRTVPREKRRHNTAPSNVIPKTSHQLQSENDMNKPVRSIPESEILLLLLLTDLYRLQNVNWRARDDLDMEVALRPRANAPDVVRSALGNGNGSATVPRERISENTIDKLFGAPNKIVIPERYIPEQLPELSAEEKRKRHEKVEAIKKMLSEAPLNSSNVRRQKPLQELQCNSIWLFSF